MTRKQLRNGRAEVPDKPRHGTHRIAPVGERDAVDEGGEPPRADPKALQEARGVEALHG